MKKSIIIITVLAGLCFALIYKYCLSTDSSIDEMQQKSMEVVLAQSTTHESVSQIQELFPKLSDIESCKYRFSEINPSPVGPTARFIAGYITLTSDANNLYNTYKWKLCDCTPLWSEPELPTTALLYSDEFSEIFRPLESTIKIYLLQDTSSLYFEGVVD